MQWKVEKLGRTNGITESHNSNSFNQLQIDYERPMALFSEADEGGGRFVAPQRQPVSSGS